MITEAMVKPKEKFEILVESFLIRFKKLLLLPNLNL